MKKIISAVLAAVMLSSTVSAMEFDFDITADNVPDDFETIGIPEHGTMTSEVLDNENVIRLSKNGDGNVIMLKNELYATGEITFEADVMVEQNVDFTMNLVGEIHSGGYKIVEIAGAAIEGKRIFLSNGLNKTECADMEPGVWYNLRLELDTDDGMISLYINDQEAAKMQEGRKSDVILSAELELKSKNTSIYMNNIGVAGDDKTEEAAIVENKVIIDEKFNSETGNAPAGFSLSGVPENASFVVSDELDDKAMKIVGNVDAVASAYAVAKFTPASGVMVFSADFIPTDGAANGKVLLNIQGTSKDTGKDVNSISVKLEKNLFSYYTSEKNVNTDVSVSKGEKYTVRVVADTNTDMAYYYINGERKAVSKLKNNVSEFTSVRIETQAMPVVFVDNILVKQASQPRISNVAIQGEAIVGGTLEGVFESSDTSGGDCVYSWYESSESGYSPISGATGKTYSPTLAQAQKGQKIRFEVTAFDAEGVPSRTVTSKATAPVSTGGAALDPPEARNVTLSGKQRLGGRITASYELVSDKGEGNSIFAWYVSDSPNGEYTPIENQTKIYIDVEQPYIGKYLRFSVTPYDKDKISGETVFSEPTEKIGDYMQFEDLDDVAWAKESIEDLVLRGSIDGVSDTSFEPSRQITRAEFVKLLMDAFALELRNANSSYNDTNGKWYREYVATAENMGFFEGIYTESFDGDTIISREDAAAIAYRITEIRNIHLQSGDTKTFNDSAEFAEYAILPIEAMTRAGIIEGKSDGMFYPKDGLTRAEAAKIVDKLSYQTLDGLSNRHPRLYVNEDDVKAMRDRVNTDEVFKERVERLKKVADAAGGPSEYKNDAGEQLWLRNVGNNLGNIAGMYLVTGDKAYAQRAEEYAVAICNYPTWGNTKGFFRDLPIGHLYQGLAIAYDWCYDEFSDETKKLIEQTCAKRTRSFYDYLLIDESDTVRSYVLQNHLWVETTGLALISISLYDKDPETYRHYINAVIERYMAVRDAQGPDGASQEGVGYWQYGVMYMLKFMSAARLLLGVDLYDTDWWRNTAYYQLYMTTPANTWSYNARTTTDPSTYYTIVDIGDCPRYSWYGPDSILMALSKEFNNGYARTLSDMYSETGYVNSSSEWLNVVFYDQSVEPKPLSDLPTMRHFEDMDIVSMRSGWTGNDSMVVFKCGTGIGEYATNKYYYDPADGEPTIGSGNSGHVHPDAGTFNIYYEGDWLIKNGGYNYRQTKNENVLLVDTLGQLEQPYDKTWFDSSLQPKYKLIPDVTTSVSNDRYDFVTGDVTPNYPMLNRWKRHLIYLKKANAVIVIDDIAAEAEHELDLMFHTDADTENVTQRDNGATVNMQRTVMEIKPLTLDNVKIKQGDYEVYSRSGTLAYVKYTMQLFNTAKEWKNAMAFTWTDKGKTPANVTLTKNGNEWVFNCDGETVTFDWTTEAVK